MLLETFNHQKLSSAIYCNNLNIKLVFSSFKIGNMFGVKDPIPGRLSVHVWFTSKHVQTVNACYVGETVRRFSTCVKEHLASDRASHIFQHLQNSEHCHTLCSADCFHILDHTSTTFQLKIKEAIHTQQPPLNQQLHHVYLKFNISLIYNSHTFSLYFILLFLIT